jgi:hypothetical protein
MFDMIKQITIHVLSEAGMGVKAPWKSKDSEKSMSGCDRFHDNFAGFNICHLETRHRFLAVFALPRSLYTTDMLLNWPSWLPGYRKLKQLGIAKREFPMHTEVLLP